MEFPPRIYGGLGVYVDCISREMVARHKSIMTTMRYPHVADRKVKEAGEQYLKL